MEVFLVRHTRTALETDVCYGASDVPLASTAAEDIARLIERLPSVASVHSSTAGRCVELASALATRDACRLVLHPELCELNFGTWEGRAWSHIDRSESDAWASDPWHRAPPGGETEQALWNRVERWYRATLCGARTGDASASFDAGPDRIAVIAHGGPLRVLRCLLLNLPASQRWTWSPALGSVLSVPVSHSDRVSVPAIVD